MASMFPAQNTDVRRQITQHLLSGLTEGKLCPKRFIQPVFLVEDQSDMNVSRQISGAHYLCVEQSFEALDQYAEAILAKGIRSLLLFAIPRVRDASASASQDSAHAPYRAVQYLKEHYPELILFADVCVCHHTPEGHCGIVNAGKIDTERTIEALKKQSILFAESGIDVLMPSGMIPGVVCALRTMLDSTGYDRVAITNQSVKFASAFFGPFQKSTFQAGSLIDKRSYQVPCCNPKEALREIVEDLYEHGDMVTVKPAFGYQDIITKAQTLTDKPLIAFLTSGEHLVIAEAARLSGNDLHTYQQRVLKNLIDAGADLIVSYTSLEWATTGQKIRPIRSH